MLMLLQGFEEIAEKVQSGDIAGNADIFLASAFLELADKYAEKALLNYRDAQINYKHSDKIFAHEIYFSGKSWEVTSKRNENISRLFLKLAKTAAEKIEDKHLRKEVLARIDSR